MRPVLLRLALAWTASCGLATLAAADNPTLQHCRAIADDRERLTCYDAAMASPATATVPAASAVTASAVTASAVTASAVTASAVTASAATDSFGQESLPKKSADTDSETPRDLQSRVASVRTDLNGKLVLALDNGQTWTQTDSPSLKLKTGDQVLIRRGVLGSYLLARVGGGPEIRVRRSR